MRKTLVLNAVGVTRAVLERMPAARSIGTPADVGHVWPAVTSSVQATYLTGTLPSEHGIVGNGWYFRDTSEIRFWHQSDRLVERPRVWDLVRRDDPGFTCANICWWNAMYSGADITVTPRPMYPADGRKIPDIWTNPPSLRHALQSKLGQFPLFKFWGPATSIDATRWIADAAIEVDRRFNPTLSLVYLPHLDYGMQRLGPEHPEMERDIAELDGVIKALLDHFLNQPGTRVILLSEYGIEPVERAVHLNRLFRQQGWLKIREELGRELLDAGASGVFAVADHQVAHVYVKDPSRVDAVKALLQQTSGVQEVLDAEGKRLAGLDHPRAGELVAVADRGAWFSYYYWLDDAKAPDFARTVDIHRKPGYDPVEVFLDPALPWAKGKIGWTLLKRRLGMRALLDVIPLDAGLVRGSHGRAPASERAGPIIMSSDQLLGGTVEPTEVLNILRGRT